MDYFFLGITFCSLPLLVCSRIGDDDVDTSARIRMSMRWVVNPSGVGALVLMLLFQASTRLTEWISMEKYREAYEAY